jgi:anti-sigma factor RsiW
LSDDLLLQRYLDGDLSRVEAEALRARLARSPELCHKLAGLRRMSGLLQLWAEGTQRRAADLVEPTLRRVQAVEQKRARHATLGFALAAALVAVLPFASQAHFTPAARLHAPAVLAPGAAIERIEARDQHARVFVVGAAGTPVVWLSDDAGDDAEAPSNQDPG